MNHSVFQLGVTFGFRAPKGYFSTDATRREIDAIAQTGATWGGCCSHGHSGTLLIGAPISGYPVYT